MPKKFFYVLLIVCIVAGAGVTGYGVYTFLNPTKVEAPMPTHEFDSDDQDTFTADQTYWTHGNLIPKVRW